jgi:spore coat polysaccharide biosynthesis protein SpsF
LILVKARSTSKRLPNKSLLSIGGVPIVEWVLSACLELDGKHTLVLCIPNNKNEKQLENFVRFKFPQVRIFKGDEENVFQRFQGAYNSHLNELLKENGTNGVIRICADRPLLSRNLISDLVHFDHEGNQLLYNHFNPLKVGPIGIGGESMSRSLAENLFTGKMSKVANFEHVTSNLYQEMPENCKFVETLPKEYFKSSFDLTVDTAEDLKMLNHIVADFQIKPGGNISASQYREIGNFLCKK